MEIINKPSTSGTELQLLQAMAAATDQSPSAHQVIFEAVLPGLGYRVDAIWPELGIVFEYDGPFHQEVQPIPDAEDRAAARHGLDEEAQGTGEYRLPLA